MQYDWKCNICVNLWKRFPCVSERFWVCIFVFTWDMALICILVFNLESYEYFRPVFVEVLCHSFMRFAKVIFFPMKPWSQEINFLWLWWNKKIYLHGKFIIEFIIEFLFLLSHMFPWMNKFLITENIFLPRLIKQESCRSWHCIFLRF